jgi:hypothetical protein
MVATIAAYGWRLWSIIRSDEVIDAEETAA